MPAPQAMIEEAMIDDEERSYNHARNKTGIVGGHNKLWSDDAQVNALWTKLCEPEECDVPAVQRSFARHVLGTLARTYFNIDNFAGYQAAAHTYGKGLASNHHTCII